jgi:DNA-binding response OmpR family regulator
MNMSANHFDKPFQTQILLLQADPAARAELARLLIAAGHVVRLTALPAQAFVWLADDEYDVIVLDLDAFEGDGVMLLHEVRRLQPDLPLVILTGRPTLPTAISAVQVGAADYLVKPLETALIVASIDRTLRSLAALKRQLGRYVRQASRNVDDASDHGPSAAAVIVAPPLSLNYSQRQAFVLGDASQTVELSRGESAILACLMAHPNQTLTTGQMARLAWSYNLSDAEAGELIRPYIHRLRRKLERYLPHTNPIVTVRGHGYQFFAHGAPSANGDNAI